MATQGRQDLDQWVTAYKVACSDDGANFNTVRDTKAGLEKVGSCSCSHDPYYFIMHAVCMLHYKLKIICRNYYKMNPLFNSTTRV